MSGHRTNRTQGPWGILGRVLGASLVVGLSLATSVADAEADTIFFDAFESDSLAAANSTALANWTVDVGNLDVVGTGWHEYLCGDGSTRCLDMDGSASNASISTTSTFSLVAGSYLFSFDYGNNTYDGNSLGYSLSGTSVAGSVFSGAAQHNTYTTYSLPFLLLSPVNNVSIGFFGGGTADSGGTVLDNVHLELVEAAAVEATAVPEPSTLLLFGTGLGLVVSRARRKN